MLTNRNILCISVPAWDSEYASTIVELMKVLGRTNKVLYVQNPYTIKDLFSAVLRRSRFPFGRVFGLTSRVQQHKITGKGQVNVLVPPLTLMINFLPEGFAYNMLLRVNGWILRRSISHHLKKLRMNSNLLTIVAFNPTLGVVMGGKFKENLLLYHCYDEIGQAVWMKKHGPRYEMQFMKMSDAVIVTSKGLFENKQAFCRNCYLVKNAADIGLFRKAFTQTLPVQQTVGFIGSLDNRLDYDLLVFLIESMPDTRFEFVGRIVDRDARNRLQKFENVHLAGPKPLEHLPDFVKNFSAGIIPFMKNEFTKGIYPLKINEYLAAGIPVVTTDFSYLDDFSGHISIADNKEAFRTLLIMEITSDSLEKKLARQEVAAQNTWENRVEQISGIIHELEERKSGQVDAST